jgi:toxin YoeB
MRKITFTSGAYADYLDWIETDRKVFLRLSNLIREASKNPGEGTGKPELLKHELAGY